MQKVLPSEGPRPLGLAAQDLLALRVVPRPRRLDQFLVAPIAPHSATRSNHTVDFLSLRCSTHHHKNSSIVFDLSLKSLPNPPLFLPFQDRRETGCFPLLLQRFMRAHVQCSLPPFGRWGWRAQSRFTYINNHATPTTTVFRGRRKPLIR